MGKRNYLIEGVSGSGKTSVCDELRRRGYHAIDGDRELIPDETPQQQPSLSEAGPEGSVARAAWMHGQHVWDVDKVMSQIGYKGSEMSFFCGGFRNHGHVIHLFDEVFVLDVDQETLRRRLALRDHDVFGGQAEEQEFILILHNTKQDIPAQSTVIDATATLDDVVDQILAQCA
ncbi:nucleoside kinase [Tateyamaria omphalii]|uniref:AAA family ATPase n=1 Tax=Tateyamaria omphalii TaxID=299262 RepID=UPI00167BF16B|nr:AAA family ATPase [Tateyamaria omphalii]GGX49569.1 nucleoside kinase [Tateyamaria omphalii]